MSPTTTRQDAYRASLIRDGFTPEEADEAMAQTVGAALARAQDAMEDLGRESGLMGLVARAERHLARIADRRGKR